MQQSRRWLSKEHVAVAQPLVLSLDVAHEKLGSRDPVCRQCFPVGRYRWVRYGLEQEFDTLWVVRGDDGDPTVFTRGFVDLLHEAKNLGVEGHRSGLVGQVPGSGVALRVPSSWG